MAFVVSFGPLDDEAQIDCETAQEALEAVSRLRDIGGQYIVVTQVQTGDVALEILEVLAIHEKSARRKPQG